MFTFELTATQVTVLPAYLQGRGVSCVGTGPVTNSTEAAGWGQATQSAEAPPVQAAGGTSLSADVCLVTGPFPPWSTPAPRDTKGALEVA